MIPPLRDFVIHWRFKATHTGLRTPHAAQREAVRC
jgi:hypothetical protein